MDDRRRGDITQLLAKANEGGPDELNALWVAVYEELREIARRHMEREFGRHLAGMTLQPTALVNEAYLRLIKQRAKYDNRGHFFAIATKVLVRVLRDYERERQAAKRGSGEVRVPLDPDLRESTPAGAAGDSAPSIEPFLDALQKVELLDSRKSEVVKLRLLWGLTIDETATAMNLGHATIERDWAFSRAWLSKELANVPA